MRESAEGVVRWSSDFISGADYALRIGEQPVGKLLVIYECFLVFDCVERRAQNCGIGRFKL